MSSRIGTVHLRYHSRGRTLASAMAPHLDRLIGQRLAEAIDARLPALLGDDGEVIVVRELNAQLAVDRRDWSLDNRFVTRLSQSWTEAIATTLARPAPDDAVVRFADQAAFVGSFIMDLLAGTAWNRWYFGAFARYRTASPVETIVAVLEDNRAHAVAIYGWLARRGRLDVVIALLGPERARLLAGDLTTSDPTHNPAELAPLIAAAFQIIEALGWLVDETTRARLTTEYLATDPLPPAWTDRRSLTAWILQLVQFASSSLARASAARTDASPETIGLLLAGSLDWLDVDWIAPQITRLCEAPAPPERSDRSTQRMLTTGHERMLDRLVELIRRGAISAVHSDGHALAVQLMAALGGPARDEAPLDRTLIAVIDRITDAFCAAVESGLDPVKLAVAAQRGPTRPGAMPPGREALAKRLEAVRAAGPAATAALQQLLRIAAGPDPNGEATSAAGLFLLTRGVLDVRLHALARDTDVPFEPLKGALAAWWFDQLPPFDGGAAAWIGDVRPSMASLDGASERLAGLRDALFERLRNQRAVDDMPQDDQLDFEERPFSTLHCCTTVRRSIAAIGWLVLRAWNRWLPGIGESSRDFLVRNCLQRAARIRLSTAQISVHLHPAPLDVIVEMAGYFKPIERVPWLDNRAISFTVRRSARL